MLVHEAYCGPLLDRHFLVHMFYGQSTIDYSDTYNLLDGEQSLVLVARAAFS